MSSEIVLKAGKLYREGKVDEARVQLVQLIKENPLDTAAWYALSYCVDDLIHKQKCLEQVLKIDPLHKRAHTALEKISGVSSRSEMKIEAAEDGQVTLRRDSANEVPKIERKIAGESTVKMGDKRRRKGLIIGIIGIVIISILAYIISNPGRFGLGGIALLVLLLVFTFSIRFIEKYIGRKTKEAKRAYRGARAEEKVGKLLESLGNGYKILHDVEYPYGNIDHVVISDAGVVFMIETKSHGGKVSMKDDEVLVNGKSPEKDFIAQSLRNTYWLRDEIEKISGVAPWVTAVLVFTKAFVPHLKPIKGVHVVNKKYLLKTIRSASKKGTANLEIINKLQMISAALSE